MNDFSNLNYLSPDVKVLLVNGQTLVDETKEKLRCRKYSFDLTSKMQLKTDCKTVEQSIKMITSGNVNEKIIEALKISIIRLKTSLDGIIGFYTR